MADVEKIPTTDTKTPKPKSRCQYPGCKNKLLLMRFSCECKKDFCMQHRFPDTHSCPVDYRSKNKDNSEEIDNLKCVADKISAI